MESFAERLYVEFAPFLRAYCYALTREEQSAQDLAQEVLLKALLHLSDLEPLSLPQLRAWLCTAARNAFADALRKKALAQKKEQPAPEGVTEDGFALSEVCALLSLLPKEDAALFRKRYMKGFNATELSELYGEKPASIRWRLKKIRDRLRTILKEENT